MCSSGGWSISITLGKRTTLEGAKQVKPLSPFCYEKVFTLSYVWKWIFVFFWETLLPSDTWFTLLHVPLKMWLDQLTGVSNKNIAAVEPRPAKKRNNLAIEDLWENLIQSKILLSGRESDPTSNCCTGWRATRVLWGRRVWAGLKIDLRLWSK